MKKTIIWLCAIVVILVAGVLVLQNVNFNRLGADQYYVQIQDGKKMEDKSDSGQKYTYYEYSLKGFNKEGKEQTVTFTANRELRKEAYLRVYLKGGQASSYQEVLVNDLPEAAKKKLDELK